MPKPDRSRNISNDERHRNVFDLSAPVLASERRVKS
jgi:hypothetical protein